MPPARPAPASDPTTALATLRRDFAAWVARADKSNTATSDWEHAASDFLRHAAAILAGAPPPAAARGRPRPALALTPARSARTVLLIRHAQALHNAGDAVAVDPWLTAAGRKAAAALRPHAGRVDLVVASPLARALETAALAFGDKDGLLASPSAAASRRRGAAAQAAPLMVSRGAGRAAVRPKPGVAYICHPDLLETDLGLPSDRIGPGTEAAFPGWQRVQIAADAAPPPPEPAASVAARAARFLAWLATRTEPRVAVVAHGGLLATLLAPHGHDHGPLAAPAFRTPFALAEARAFVVCDWNGAVAVSEWW